MNNPRFHEHATYLAGSMLLELHTTCPTQVYTPHDQCIETIHLTEQLKQLREINMMQSADLESRDIEKASYQSYVVNESLRSEMEIVALHIAMCQKDIDLCRLRMELFNMRSARAHR